MLQAQEQAWLAMAGSGAMENLGPAAGAAGGELGAAASGGDDAGAAAGEPEELTDEEMARRLQEEVGAATQAARAPSRWPACVAAAAGSTPASS